MTYAILQMLSHLIKTPPDIILVHTSIDLCTDWTKTVATMSADMEVLSNVTLNNTVYFVICFVLPLISLLEKISM